MKFTNKIKWIIFSKNFKLISSSILILSIFFLLIISSIITSIIINFNFDKTFTIAMQKIKLMWFIKYCTEIIFNSSLIFSVCYLLFFRQKESGLHNIEIRSGIKIYNIFFLRVAVGISFLYATYFLNLIFSGIIFSISQIPSLILKNNIFPVSGFIFLYIFIFYIFCIILMVSFKLVISTIIISLSSVIVSIGPVISSIKYHENQNSLVDLKKINNISSANARLNYGINFYKFIDKNKSYQWLLNDFPLLEYKNEEPYCKPNDPFCRYSGWGSNVDAWLSGQWLGTIGDNIFKLNIETLYKKGKIDRMPKYFDFAAALNEFLKNNRLEHWKNVATKEDYMFDSGLPNYSEHYDKNKNSLKIFFQDLAHSNFVFENVNYNNLFMYLSKISDDIRVYNEIGYKSELQNVGKYHLNGTLIPYAYSTPGNSFQNIFWNTTYSHTLLPPAFWFLGQNIRYSMTLDNIELEVIQKNNEYNSLAAMNFMINPLIQFQLMSSGKYYKNEYISDVFNTNGEYFNFNNNRYLRFKIDEKLRNISPTRGFVYDLRFKSETIDDVNKSTYKNSELNLLSFKDRSYVYVELMYICYFLIFTGLCYASYLIYKKRIIL